MSRGQYPSEESPTQLREYIRVLRLRKWSILLLVVLTTVGAFLYSVREQRIYQSTVKVLLKPPTSNQLSPDIRISTTVDPATEQQIAHSSTVAQMVATSLHLPQTVVPMLLSHVSVNVPINTLILNIAYSAGDPVQAKTRAQAFADEYLALKTSQAQATLNAVRTGLNQRLARLHTQLAHVNQTLVTALPNTIQLQSAETDHDLLVAQITSLSDQLSSLDLLNVDPGDVIQAAGLPASPVRPRYPLNLAVGLLAGLALGLGVAFVREWLDDRIKSPRELEESVAAPALAVIPKFKHRRRAHRRSSLLAESEPHSAASEAFRALRASAQYASSERRVKTILVTSPLDGEGKTTTTANLAVALAAAGKSVIVVSADLRKPRIHELFRLPERPGLTDALNGGGNFREYLQASKREGLRFLGSGEAGQPAEILESQKMKEILAELRSSADFVLIDSPSVLQVADSLSLARLVDGVLLVVGFRSTPVGALTLTQEKLNGVGATLFGAVLNNFEASKSAE
jgi:polysaccharide biosynthesis transport protein